MLSAACSTSLLPVILAAGKETSRGSDQTRRSHLPCPCVAGQVRNTSVSVVDAPQDPQSSLRDEEQVQAADNMPLQQAVQIEHYTSDDGISHFDDDAQGQQDVVHDRAHGAAAQTLVGHDGMSALQASLPVGVCMTHGSTQ